MLDDEGKSITLTDQNGNTVKLDRSGITLDSAGDVKITATEGRGDHRPERPTSTITGLNVTATGQIEFIGIGQRHGRSCRRPAR